jgi:hypothetical protein
MKTEILRGIIGSIGAEYDTEDISIGRTWLVSFFENELYGKQVSVKYWISENEMTDEEIKENALLKIVGGEVDACKESAYSEYTGYLWTDATLNVGGHDLFAELTEKEGKYILMEINIHE